MAKRQKDAGPKTQLFGYKRGMTTILREDGSAYGVTLIELAEAVVTQVKTETTDGYTAIQLGLDPVKAHRLNKPERGHLEKKNGGDLPNFKTLRELRDVGNDKTIGDTLPTEQFVVGNIVHVQSESKGKGFAGVVKRYHFHGQDETHGVSQVHRKPMSGGATDAARTFPGSRRPGRMGDETVTVRNLRIVGRDDDLKLIALQGGVPGATGALVKLTYAGVAPVKLVKRDESRVGQQKQKKKK